MNDLVKQLLPEVKRDLKRVIDYDNRYLVRAAKGIERHTKALKTNQAMLASADTPEMEQKLDAILEEVKKLGVTGLKMDSYYCGMSGRKKLNGRLQDATVRFSFSTLGIAASVTVNYMHLAYIRYFSKLTVNNRELDLILETK